MAVHDAGSVRTWREATLEFVKWGREALLHPRRPGPARPLRRQSRARAQHATAPPTHFLFTWLKTQGVDDALIQPYSGHATRTSLKIYSRLAITDAQREYDAVIDRFPV